MLQSMKKRLKPMRILVLQAMILVGLAGYVSSSRAADLDEVMACATANGDDSVAACTRQIQSNTLTGSTLALAYYNRGAGYVNKDNTTKEECLKAVADFTAAIRIQPDLGAAYYARGKTYEALGDHEHSASDLAQAVI